jgi:hypothetical protein
VSEARYTHADRAYLRANYVTLEELCTGHDEDAVEIRRLIDQGVLPRASYVVDGVGVFPVDYFRLYDDAGGCDRLRGLFAERYRTAATPYPELATDEALAEAWRAYLDGIWGQCLRAVTPETIVRKQALVSSLCKLIALPRRRDADWQAQLRAEVTELDEIEREFAPDYDRAEEWNDRPPTRDLLIDVARERFPDVFAHTATDGRRARRAETAARTEAATSSQKSGR